MEKTNNPNINFAHTSPAYTQELERLHQQIVDMAKASLDQVSQAFLSLQDNQLPLAKQVMKNDQQINATEKKIDSEITLMIARRQPAARDLRMMVSGLKLIQDLERISDEAKRFASFSAFLVGDDKGDVAKPLTDLCELVVGRLTNSIHALENLDLSEAMIQLRKDADIEVELRHLNSYLVRSIKTQPEDALLYLRLSGCIRSCERISDHCSNICEFIVFQVQGLDVRHLSDE